MKNITLYISIIIAVTSCSMGKVVSSVQINAIELKHVQPTSPDKVYWDPFGSGLGDVQIKIKNISTGQIIYTSEVYDDASSKNTYLFMRNMPLLISDLNVGYRVDIYDYDDLSSDEWMGGFEIRFPDHKDQNEILLKNNTNPTDVKLLVDWTYMKKKKKNKKLTTEPS